MHAAYHGYIKRFGVLNAIFSRINRKFVPSATGSYLVLLEVPARPAILEGSLAHSVVKSIDPGLLEALGWNNWMLEILEYDCGPPEANLDRENALVERGRETLRPRAPPMACPCCAARWAAGPFFWRPDA